MKKVGKVLLIIALILVLLLALAYGALQGLLGHGPFRFLNTMYLKSLPGNAEIYRPENVAPVENSPLSGMNLCFLGSSVTEGAASLETSFAEYIAVRNNWHLCQRGGRRHHIGRQRQDLLHPADAAQYRPQRTV